MKKFFHTFPQIKMFRFLFGVAVIVGVWNCPGWAERPAFIPSVASYTETHCSGFVAGKELTPLAIIVGAEEGKRKNDSTTGDLIYMDRGQQNGIQLHQEYFVIRRVSKINHAGTLFKDIGHIRVVDVHEGVSVGRIELACEPMSVDDWVIPSQARATPPARPAAPLDRFARPSGKAIGRIVASKENARELGKGQIVYLNVGMDQSVKVGDVLRIFRPFREGSVNPYNKHAFRKVSKKSSSPRQIVGECVVLHAAKGASTVIITESISELTVGDWVELE